MNHSTFIDALGGPTLVAEALTERIGKHLTSQAVSNWKRRGIPYRYRGPLMVMAQEKAVQTPNDFFGVAGGV